MSEEDSLENTIRLMSNLVTMARYYKDGSLTLDDILGTGERLEGVLEEAKTVDCDEGIVFAMADIVMVFCLDYEEHV